MSSGFSIRERCNRWLMAAIIALWAISGAAAAPQMSAAECRDTAMGSGCDRMNHAETPHHTYEEGSSANHKCCKKKAKGKPSPAKAQMPNCPMDEGQIPRTCGMAEISCCAVVGHEETRRAAKPENTTGNETSALLLTKIRPGTTLASFDRRDRHLSDGLVYEKPVFDLKTDLRV